MCHSSQRYAMNGSVSVWAPRIAGLDSSRAPPKAIWIPNDPKWCPSCPRLLASKNVFSAARRTARFDFCGFEQQHSGSIESKSADAHRFPCPDSEATALIESVLSGYRPTIDGFRPRARLSIFGHCAPIPDASRSGPLCNQLVTSCKVESSSIAELEG